MERAISYIRVSTQKQGRSGLGLEAQREIIAGYASRVRYELVAEFKDVASGAKSDRTQLLQALDYAELTGARILIAKLDRLSRDLEFIAALQKRRVPFTCADCPEANEAMIQFLAVMAQYERKQISERTRVAMAVARSRGRRFGVTIEANRNPGAHAVARAAKAAKARARARKVARFIDQAKREGAVKLSQISDWLNNSTVIRTTRGSAWTPTAVRRVLILAAKAENAVAESDSAG